MMTANWIQQADTALKRAANRAHETAALTKTPIHVMREEPPAYGTKSK